MKFFGVNAPILVTLLLIAVFVGCAKSSIFVWNSGCPYDMIRIADSCFYKKDLYYYEEYTFVEE